MHVYVTPKNIPRTHLVQSYIQILTLVCFYIKLVQ